jgi:ribokinase
METNGTSPTRRIFLSSTYEDLVEYRSAVQELITRHGELYTGMENFGAQSARPLEVCLNEVARSDAVIVIVGARYGTLCDSSGYSYTHREVEHAKQQGIPVFVFIQRNPIKVSNAEQRRRRKFVEWLGHYSHATFEDSVSLVTEVAVALHRLDAQNGGRRLGAVSNGESNTNAWREILDRADGAADIDCLALSAHNVDRIYAVDLVSTENETVAGEPAVMAGGSGANTLAGLAKLGLRTSAAGIVGADEDGEFLRDALTEHGVVPLLAPPGRFTDPTGTTMTFTDPQGHRTIFVEPGINARCAAAAKGTYWPKLVEAVETSRVIHFTSFAHNTELRLQASLANHVPDRALVSFAPGALYSRHGLSRLLPLLKRVNLLFLYEHQLDALLKDEQVHSAGRNPTLREKLNSLYKWKAKHDLDEPLAVIVKSASDSAQTNTLELAAAIGQHEVSFTERGTIDLVGDVRDNTGAGDASATGILSAVLKRSSLSGAVDAGLVVARSVSSERGARPGLPTSKQLQVRRTRWLGG